MVVTVRLARTSDVEVLRELARLAYEHYIPRMGREPIPMTADYADLVARGTTWAAEEAGAVVGFIVLIDQPDHLLVDILTVAPHAQRRGIGAQLLRLAEQQAHDHHLDEVRLCTNELMTENLDYYPRRGYVETHRESQSGFRRVFFTKALGRRS